MLTQPIRVASARWLALFVLCPVAGADWVQTGGPPGGNITHLTGLGEKVFVQIQGAVLVSNDGGQTFSRPANAGLANSLAQIVQIDNAVFAITNDERLLVSTDDAQSFTLTTLGNVTSNVVGLHPLAGDDGLLVRVEREAPLPPQLWRTADLGSTWIELPLPGVPVALMVAGDALLGLAAHDELYRSVDDGASWQLSDPGFNADVWVPHLATPEVVILKGGFGHGLRRSTNGGLTWQAFAIPGVAASTIESFAAVQGQVVARTGTGVHRSANRGATWTPAAGAGFPRNGDRMWSTGDHLLLVSDAGQLLRSIDLGDSWHEAGQGIVGTKTGVVAAKGGILFASGAWSGPSYRSLDDGATWQIMPDLGHDIAHAFFIDGDAVYAGTGSHGLWRSLDDGATWHPRNDGLPLILPSKGIYEPVRAVARVGDELFVGTGGAFIFVADGSHCACSGTTSGQGVYRSSDDSATWSQVANGLPINTFVFGDPIYRPIADLAHVNGVLLAATVGGGVYRSANLGQSWSPASGTTGTLLFDLEVTGSTIYLVGRPDDGVGAAVHRSLDNGASWSPHGVIPPAITGFSSITAHGGSLYASGSFQAGPTLGIWRSSDGGASWTLDSAELKHRVVNTIAPVGNTLMAGTLGTGVWLRAELPGDIDGNGSVDVNDLLLLIGAWGACDPSPAACPADINSNSVVDVNDLLLLIGNWS